MMGTWRPDMIERGRVGGVLVAIAGVLLPVTGVGAGEGTQQAPMILNLMNRPIESRERAFTEDIKREALAPRPSAVDEWEPQPDGSMRNTKPRVSVTVRS